MKKLVFGYFECLSLDEAFELMRIMHDTMAYEITNGDGETVKFAAYGYFEGNAYDWGFEDATCSLFKGETTYERLKSKFEIMKANGEF